jgi:hypothetical protein
MAVAMMKKLLIPAVLITAAILPSPAAAATRKCGTEGAASHGRVFAVQATNTTCRTAKNVAGGWFNVQSHDGTAPSVYDTSGNRWRCRVTEEATGTDPGYNPYTKVRCVRRSKVARFKLRS